MVERVVLVRIAADATSYQAAMLKASAATKGLDANVKRTAATTRGGFGAIGGAAAIAGAALVAGFAGAVRTGTEFRKSMSGVAAVAGATDRELRQLSDAAIAAGADTRLAGVTASTAAEAERELLKAGVDVADVLSGALTGSLSLAIAGQMDQAEAATIAAQAMNVWKLEGKDVSHIADVLAAGANKSAADVDELGQAMRQSALVAAQFDIDLETTVGTLSLFADNALVGSDAGTSFRTMLQRLNPQSEEAAALMDQLGLSAYDSQGNFIGLAEYAGELQTALSGMSQEQRNATMNTLFGSDAVRAANILFREGEEGIRKYEKAVEDEGAATRMAARQTDNLAGDLEALGGTFESVAINATESLDGMARGAVKAANRVVDAFAALPTEVQAAGVIGGGVAGTIGLIGGAALIAVPKIHQFRQAWEAMEIASTRTGRLLTGTRSFLMGPWGIALAAATISIGLYADRKAQAAAYSESFKATLDAETGAITDNTEALVAKKLEEEGLLRLTEQVGISSEDYIAAILGEEEALKAVNTQLDDWYEKQVASGAALGAALDPVQRLSAGLQRHGEQVSVDVEAQERLAEATGKAGDKQRKAAKDVGTFADAAKGAVPETEELTDSAQALQSAFDGFSEPMRTYTDLLTAKEEKEREAAQATADSTKKATDSWEDYAKDVKVSLREYARALERQIQDQREWQRNLKTIAARGGADVARILADMGPEAAGLVRQMANGTDGEMRRMSRLLREEAALGADQTVAGFDRQLGAIEAVGRAAGKKTAEQLAAELQIGVGKVEKIAKQYGFKLAESVNPVLIAIGEEKIRFVGQKGGGSYLKAAGGPIRGPGGDTDDKIPAWLSNGEYVIRAAAARTIGTGLLDKLNQADRFAKGGLVELFWPGNDPVGGHHNHLHAGLATYAQAVALGQAVEKLGFDVWQHPSFGPGIGNRNGFVGGHSPGSLHYAGRALDINWYGSGSENAKLAWLASWIRGRVGSGIYGMAPDLPGVPKAFGQYGMLGQVGSETAGHMRAATEAWLASTMPSGPFDSGVGAGGLKAMAKAKLVPYGWQPQWRYVDELVSRESSWNPQAQNPTSSAYGLFQFLDSTWASVGGHKTSDPGLQTDYGYRYIDQRHDDPRGALAFHDRHNWYGGGGKVTASMQSRDIDRLVSAMSRGGKVEIHQHFNTPAEAQHAGTAVAWEMR